jgi:acyl dehydratase
MNLHALRDHRFPRQRVSYTDRDTILYALTVGVGADPLDANQLRLAYEKNLASLPTMAAVLAHPGMWLAEPQFEINYLKLLHGEQNLTVHAPLPPQGELDASYRVVAVVDKGVEKGALAYFEKELRNAGNGELLCTVSSTLFLRADGGAGSFGTPPPALPTGELGKVDFTDEIATKIDSALFYRLNGDRNPIHVDPAAAAKAGFTRPILHGLCTYGAVGYMLVRTVCGHDPARLRSLGVRFSSPVYPGETIRIEGSRMEEGVYFNATVPARQQLVLTSGFARIG